MIITDRFVNMIKNSYKFFNIIHIYNHIFSVSFLNNFIFLILFFFKIFKKVINKNFLFFFKKFCSYKYSILPFFFNDFFFSMGSLFIKKFKNYLKFSLLHITYVLNYQWEMIYKKIFNSSYLKFLSLNRKSKISFDSFILLKVSRVLFFNFLLKNNEICSLKNLIYNKNTLNIKKPLSVSLNNNFLFNSNDYTVISKTVTINIKNNYFNSIYKNSYKRFSILNNKNIKFNFFSDKVNIHTNESEIIYSYKNSFFHFKDNDFTFFYKSTLNLEYNMNIRLNEDKTIDKKLDVIEHNNYVVSYFNDYIIKKYEIKFKKRIKKILKIEYDISLLKDSNLVLSEDFKNLYYNSLIIYNNFIINFLLKNSNNLKKYSFNYNKIQHLLNWNLLKNGNVIDITSLTKLDNIKKQHDFDMDKFLEFINFLSKNYKVTFFKKDQNIFLNYDEFFLVPNFFFQKDFLVPSSDLKSNNQLIFSENFLSKVQALNPSFKFFYNRDFDINIDSLRNFYFYFYKKFINVSSINKKSKGDKYSKILYYFNYFWLANKSYFNFNTKNLIHIIINIYNNKISDDISSAVSNFKKYIYSNDIEFSDDLESNIISQIDSFLIIDGVKSDLLKFIKNVNNTGKYINVSNMDFYNPLGISNYEISIEKLVFFNSIKNQYNPYFKLNSDKLLINHKILNMMFKNLNYIPNYLPEDVLFYNMKKPASYLFIKCRPAFVTYYKNFYDDNLLVSNPFLDILQKIMILNNKIYLKLMTNESPYIHRLKSSVPFRIHLQLNRFKEVMRNIEEYRSLKSKNLKDKNNNFYNYTNKIYSELYNKYSELYNKYKEKYSMYEKDNLTDYYFNGNFYKLCSDKKFSELYLLNNSTSLILKSLNSNKLLKDKSYSNLSIVATIDKQNADYNFISIKESTFIDNSERDWTFENELTKYIFFKNKSKILFYNLFYSGLVRDIPVFVSPFYSDNINLNLDLNPFLLNIYLKEDPLTCYIPENLSIFHIFTNFNLIKEYFFENPVYLFREILIFKNKFNLANENKLNLNLSGALDLYKNYFLKNNKLLFTFSNYSDLKNIIINKNFFLFFFKKYNINIDNRGFINFKYFIKNFLSTFKISILDIFLDNNSKLLFKDLKIENLIELLSVNYFSLYKNLNTLKLEFNIQMLYENIILNNFNFYFNISNFKDKKVILNKEYKNKNLNFLNFILFNLFNNKFFNNDFSLEIEDTFYLNFFNIKKINKSSLEEDIIMLEKNFYNITELKDKSIYNNKIFENLNNINFFCKKIYSKNSNTNSKITTFNFDLSLKNFDYHTNIKKTRDKISDLNLEQSIDPFVINLYNIYMKYGDDYISFILKFEKILLSKKFISNLSLSLNYINLDFIQNSYCLYEMSFEERNMLFYLILLYIVLIFKKSYLNVNLFYKNNISVYNLEDIIYSFFFKDSKLHNLLFYFFNKNDFNCINFVFSDFFFEVFYDIIHSFVPQNFLIKNNITRKNNYERLLSFYYNKKKNLKLYFTKDFFYFIDLDRLIKKYTISDKKIVLKHSKYYSIDVNYNSYLDNKKIIPNSHYLNFNVYSNKFLNIKHISYTNSNLYLLSSDFLFFKKFLLKKQSLKIKNVFFFSSQIFDFFYKKLFSSNLFFNNSFINFNYITYNANFSGYFSSFFNTFLKNSFNCNNLNEWFFSFIFLIKIGFLNFISRSSSFLNSLFFFINKQKNKVFYNKFWNDRGFFFPIEIPVYKFFFLYYSNFFFNFFETSTFLNFNSFYNWYQQKKIFNLNRFLYKNNSLKKKSNLYFSKFIPKKKKFFFKIDTKINNKLLLNKSLIFIDFRGYVKNKLENYKSNAQDSLENLYVLYSKLYIENRTYLDILLRWAIQEKKFYKIKLKKIWIFKNRILKFKKIKKYKVNFFSSKNTVFNSFKYNSLYNFVNAISPFINVNRVMLKNLRTSFLFNNDILNFKLSSFTDKINYENVKHKPLNFLKYIFSRLMSYSFINFKNNYLEDKRSGKLGVSLRKFYHLKFFEIKDLNLKIKSKKIFKYKKNQFIVSNKNFLFILKYKNYLKRRLKNFLFLSHFNKDNFQYNSLNFSKNFIFSNFFFEKKSVERYINKKLYFFEKLDAYNKNSSNKLRFLRRRRLSARKKVNLKKFLFQDLSHTVGMKVKKNIYNNFNDLLEYVINTVNSKSYLNKFFYFSKKFKILKQRFKKPYNLYKNNCFMKNTSFLNNLNFEILNIEDGDLLNSFFFNKIWLKKYTYSKLTLNNKYSDKFLYFKINKNFKNFSKFSWNVNIYEKYWSSDKKYRLLEKKIKNKKKMYIFKNKPKFDIRGFQYKKVGDKDTYDIDDYNLNLIFKNKNTNDGDNNLNSIKLNNKRNKFKFFKILKFKKKRKYNLIFKKTLLFFDNKINYSSKVSKKFGITGFLSLINNEKIDNYNLFNNSKLYTKFFNKFNNLNIQNFFFKNKVSTLNPVHTYNNYFFKIQNLKSKERFLRVNYLVKKPNILFRMKPGYLVLWRSYRRNFNDVAHLNFYRQRRMTNYFLNFKKANSLLILRNFEFSIFSIVKRSNFFLDYTLSLLCFRLGMVYLNGKKILDKNIQVYLGDRIQIALTFSYLIQFKWFFFFLNIRRIKFLNKYVKSFFNIKNNSISLRKLFLEFSKKLFRKFLYYCKDIPNYLEVDFFLMLSTVIYEPFMFYEFDPILIYRIPYLSMRLYNWKYIN